MHADHLHKDLLGDLKCCLGIKALLGDQDQRVEAAHLLGVPVIMTDRADNALPVFDAEQQQCQVFLETCDDLEAP